MAGVTFDPVNPVGGGSGNTAMTVHVPVGYPPGTYGITILSSSSATSHNVSATLTVLQGADFTITATNPQTVVQGGSASYTISMTPIGTFSGAVTLSMGAITGGVSAVLNTHTISPGAPAVLTLSATPSATLGTFVIPVAGSNGSISHAALVVRVSSPPPNTIALGTVAASLNGQASMIASPLAIGDTITGCTPSMTGVTLSTPQAQILRIAAVSPATTGLASVTCSTSAGHTLTASIDVGEGPSLTATATPSSTVSGNFEIDVFGSGFGPVQGVTICGLGCLTPTLLMSAPIGGDVINPKGGVQSIVCAVK